MSPNKWRAIIDPLLAETDYELVGVECTGGLRHTRVRIYIDKPGGILMEDIVKLTRRFNVVFDVEAPISGAYLLEVSSPGLDRPLYTPVHFQQQIGQKISLKTQSLFEDRQNFKGTLLMADEKQIQVDVEGKPFTFSYDEIQKARVIPDIKIGASGKK